MKIYFCPKSELPCLQRFIHEKWSRNHILSISKELIDFQHLALDKYNFIVARNDNENDYLGILGFVPVAKFDTDLAIKKDFWLALWKIDEKRAPVGLGISLLKTFEKMFSPKSIGIVGINSNVRKMYEMMNFTTGVMNHFYIANNSITNFKIAENLLFNKYDDYSLSSNLFEINDLMNVEELCNEYQPDKTKTYLINRYLNHPVYNYSFWGAYTDEILQAILVFRKNKVENACCFHIVDIVGNLSKVNFLGDSLYSILNRYDAEYIDCLNAGLDKAVFKQWGFLEKGEETIIPTYFEPFEKINVEIQYAFKTINSNYVIFKGDGDQDRPNILLR